MKRQSLSELIPLLETELGLEQGFFDSLDSDDENDWSFVIKAHALAEAATSHLLTKQFQKPELADLFSRLDMSNKATGKAAFIKAMGLLGEHERRFISSFSELRNRLVHDVRVKSRLFIDVLRKEFWISFLPVFHGLNR